MTEPKKIHVVRPHQTITEYAYERSSNTLDDTHDQVLIDQKDYQKLGWRRINAVQSLPLKDSWPITIGNGVATFSSGLVGGLITRRMARNLSLHVTLSTLPTAGASFFIVTLTHLSAYYYLVLQPMFSNDPMLCKTCLEIRSFTLGTFVPLVIGTSGAVLANLSACLLNKTIRLPEFNIQAYPEWKRFFQRHAFKGMSRRYFVAYPLISGFISTAVFLVQDYSWRNELRPRLDVLEKQSPPPKQSRKSNQLFAPVQNFFAQFFGGKTK